MSNYTEYVFCPYCGGITAPGTCVNCGMSTAETQVTTDTYQATEMQEQPMNSQSLQPDMQSQFMYGQSSQYDAQTQSMYGQLSQYDSQTQSTYGQSSQYDAQTQSMFGQSSQMNNVQQMYGAYQQPYNTYIEQEPPKKKSRWWIWLLIVTAVLVLGLVVAIAAVIAALVVPLFMVYEDTSTTAVTTQPQATVVEVPTSEDESDYYDYDTSGGYDDYDSTIPDITVYERELARINLDYIVLEGYFEEALAYTDTTDGSKDIFLASDYVSTFGSNHDNHSLDEFTGIYYEPFVDCIDTSYDYGLSRHYMEYAIVQDNVPICACIAYIQLEGDVIPNQDAINQQIFMMTANDLFAQLEGYSYYGIYGQNVTFIVDSFVTYNDAEKMSILLDVNIVEDNVLSESYIYAINIDLVNGEIMDNGAILNVDSDFAAIFREKCCAQNGTDIDGLNYLSDSELAAFLCNDKTNIVFFTPYGLEVGYAYETSDGTRGWMTITMTDYEEYLQ